MISIAIEVDTTLHVAYIQLSHEPIVRTVDFDDNFLIDLDDMNVAVGIEVLDEGAMLPFSHLISEYHVRTEVVELLRLMRPNVSSYLELTQGNDGRTQSRPLRQLQPA